MPNFDIRRAQGLRRWEEWLTARIKPWGIVRETANEDETRDAVWRIGFPDDTRARVRLTYDALRLGKGDFEELVIQLEEADCLGRLRAVSPGGLRIHSDGRMEEVEPEGIESDHG